MDDADSEVVVKDENGSVVGVVVAVVSDAVADVVSVIKTTNR